MKKAKFWRASALALALTMAIAIVPVMAADNDSAPTNPVSPRTVIDLATNYSGSFNSAWQRTYSEPNSSDANVRAAFLTYGYNTFLIDEDYAWAENSRVCHWAQLKNGNGWHESIIRRAGKVAKIEVTHAGSWVYYYCTW